MTTYLKQASIQQVIFIIIQNKNTLIIHYFQKIYLQLTVDVSYFVTEDSPIDKCALERTTSVYLVQKVIPMVINFKYYNLNKSFQLLKFKIFSRYFNSYIIFIFIQLPRLLCEELCSLNPGLDRLTFSVIWKMKTNGDVKYFIFSVIHF